MDMVKTSGTLATYPKVESTFLQLVLGNPISEEATSSIERFVVLMPEKTSILTKVNEVRWR